MFKENLSFIPSFNLQGEAGPEGPAGPRVSHDQLTLKYLHIVHKVFMMKYINGLFHFIGSSRPNWGAREGRNPQQ